MSWYFGPAHLLIIAQKQPELGWKSTLLCRLQKKTEKLLLDLKLKGKKSPILLILFIQLKDYYDRDIDPINQVTDELVK